ncbi:MAG: class I adenylate-forming enzyme family protein [Myxococcota bacterium]
MGSLQLRLQPDEDRLTLGRFLEDVAERHGDRVALVSGERAIRYRELEREVCALAAGLVGAGVVKGARIALLLGNRPEWVQAFFAAGRVGAVLVPVNTFASPEECDYILRHGDASLLLLQESLEKHRYRRELEARHPELAQGEPGRLRCPALPQLRRVVSLDQWEALLALGTDVPEGLLDGLAAEVGPSDDALVIYTSGTTALPKGVLHAQRAPVIQSWRFAELMALAPEDRVLTAQPFFWTAGIAMSLGASLAAGACLWLEQVFDPARVLETIERERITTLHAWPHQEQALAEHPDAAHRDLSSLRKLRFSSALARRAGIEKDEWGADAAYGLSETFTLASSLPATAPAHERRACHGKALPGMALRILDPQSGAELAPGKAGEIAVKGVTLMRGYHKVPSELCLDAEGWFRTQDGGSVDAEGALHWSGRLSNLVKTGGANVSPLEVEAALSGHPALRAALAVGVPHPTLGEALVLCAVAAEGVDPTEDDVRTTLREHLAAYKVPRRVLFFQPDELSFTGTQKIQLGPLREAALARLRAEGAEIAGHRYEEEGRA